jgi:hypothetical protein
MTTEEKLRENIKTLKESIHIGFTEKNQGVPGAREHLKWCFEELKTLANQLEAELTNGQ